MRLVNCLEVVLCVATENDSKSKYTFSTFSWRQNLVIAIYLLLLCLLFGKEQAYVGGRFNCILTPKILTFYNKIKYSMSIFLVHNSDRILAIKLLIDALVWLIDRHGLEYIPPFFLFQL